MLDALSKHLDMNIWIFEYHLKMIFQDHILMFMDTKDAMDAKDSPGSLNILPHILFNAALQKLWVRTP